ncbi:MAG: hypothetical protein R6X02_23255 [Enhygromyxa sp.]
MSWSGDFRRMQWRFASAIILWVGLLGCGDDGRGDEANSESETTGDGDGEPGDGDGEPGDGDGDGEPGDGDGDGDGDGEPGDGDGDGEPGDGDGDDCDTAAFLGAGIAEDHWGIGDSCDEIYVCVNNIDYDALVDLLDLSEQDCMADLGCGDGQRCTLSHQTVVDDASIAEACAALTIVNSVWCAVLGP